MYEIPAAVQSIRLNIQLVEFPRSSEPCRVQRLVRNVHSCDTCELPPPTEHRHTLSCTAADVEHTRVLNASQELSDQAVHMTVHWPLVLHVSIDMRPHVVVVRLD